MYELNKENAEGFGDLLDWLKKIPDLWDKIEATDIEKAKQIVQALRGPKKAKGRRGQQQIPVPVCPPESSPWLNLGLGVAAGVIVTMIIKK